MPPTYPISLTVFEQTIATDPMILGMLYTGSLGRGTADSFSDLDIVIWLANESDTTSSWVRDDILQRIGRLHFVYGSSTKAVGFVGPEWQRVDLSLSYATDLHPSPQYTNATIIKDSHQSLSTLVAASPALCVTTTSEQVYAALAEAIDSQIYLALHNARGAIWSAMGEVSYRCAELYTLLARLRGYESFGFRYVEQILTQEEHKQLVAAWPTNPTRIEVRRAAQALWQWTKVVWREAELVVTQPLGLKVDEANLLATVERIYSRS